MFSKFKKSIVLRNLTDKGDKLEKKAIFPIFNEKRLGFKAPFAKLLQKMEALSKV